MKIKDLESGEIFQYVKEGLTQQKYMIVYYARQSYDIIRFVNLATGQLHETGRESAQANTVVHLVPRGD